jgi:hypothetical protein
MLAEPISLIRDKLATGLDAADELDAAEFDAAEFAAAAFDAAEFAAAAAAVFVAVKLLLS